MNDDTTRPVMLQDVLYLPFSMNYYQSSTPIKRFRGGKEKYYDQKWYSKYMINRTCVCTQHVKVWGFTKKALLAVNSGIGTQVPIHKEIRRDSW